MNWTDEDVEHAWVAWRKRSEPHAPEKALSDAMRRVMTRAVELAAARGGTKLIQCTDCLRIRFDDGKNHCTACGDGGGRPVEFLEDDGHIFISQGATVATLQQEVQRLKAIIAYIQECDGGPHLLTEAGVLAADRQDEVREEVATLQAKVGELEKAVTTLRTQREVAEARSAQAERARDTARTNAEHWHARALAAESRLVAVREELDAARVSAGAARDLLKAAERERDSIRGELVSLRLQMQPSSLERPDPTTLEEALTSLRLWRAGARRLAANARGIRERFADGGRWLKEAEAGFVLGEGPWDEDVHSDVMANHILPNLGKAADRALRWVLEGDAPQEANGHVIDCDPRTFGDVEPPTRDPCSPTCTHDDAAKPGHPERVKERSEAVEQALLADATPQKDLETMCTFIEEEGDMETTQAMRRFREGWEQSSKPVDVPADFAWGESDPDPYSRGSEAMRAACLEVVLGVCGRYGLGQSGLIADLKAAIEGVAP